VALAACGGGGGGGGGSAGTSASSGDNGSGSSGTGSSSGGSGSSGSGGGSAGSGSGSGSGGSGSGSGSGGGGSGSAPQASNCTVTPTSVTCPPWTWEGGSNTLDAPGVYGTQGTPAGTNIPGARQQPVAWTDPSGNLWLFGGLGQDDSVADPAGLLNDLWRYNPTSGQWTWVSGSNTIDPVGVYGQLGTPAATNIPTPRYQAAAWTDASGNLWLFGGLAQNDYSVLAPGDKLLNDLWEYNPSTNEWTWMSGSNTYNTEGVYGAVGTPAGSNVPPPRVGASTWIDTAGNLWLFGGTGYDPTVYQNLGQYNDLWKFNPTTRQWTWVGGQSPSTDPTLNDFFAGQDYQGLYGTLGTPAGSNFPGSREFASTWVDASGNFWMFGGDGYDESGKYGLLNDLWEYNPTSGEWTWVSGSSTINPVALYGTQGVPAAGNAPGPRTDASVWTDKSGNVWLCGGGGLDGSGAKGELSDLWEYSPSTSQWTWVSGPDTVTNSGNYGSLGVAAPSNNPGGRLGAVSWTDSEGNHWLFGGYGLDDGDPSELAHQQYLNDLWRF
jgi:N-acetylneuraminic acid mutarotase